MRLNQSKHKDKINLQWNDYTKYDFDFMGNTRDRIYLL